jgi:hypothetical protein
VLAGFRDEGVCAVCTQGTPDLKKLARHFLIYTDEQIATTVQQTELKEVFCDDQEKE